MHIAVRRLLVPLTAGAVAFTGLTAPAQAAPQASGKNAAKWQATQLDAHGRIYNDQFDFTDWGLTVDTLIALKATGARPQIAEKSTAYVAAHVRSYNSLDDWGQPGVRFSGATGKLLYLAVATRSNPRNFGGFDLRAESLALMTTSGADKGRFQDQGTTDYSNTFGQSFNVLGLTRSGGVPNDAVKYLVKQQCDVGGFRLYPDAVATACDQATDPVLDPDSTAMAVQSLLAASKAGNKAAGRAARKGALWLLRQQAADGSVQGSGPTAAPNTNSTGLAGQALRAVGQSGLVGGANAQKLRAGAAKAGRWVQALQLTSNNAGQAGGDIGAIAYDQTALTDAQQNGITAANRDQWRRATPQALLVLARTGLDDIGE
ncbi:hypothetical protein ACFOY4_41600 [Actinomadura syzygii]|uniref:Cell wall anchor protein n=1 Tax=Actinomadura syzygii TaxID=1427538 RepID=A0A5D0TQC9_9ACTN|nr:cell wall anchor protein [Actinomadura syzygii]TYC07610.1 cell wall anchor protein [Actinomadura syzygii]